MKVFAEYLSQRPIPMSHQMNRTHTVKPTDGFRDAVRLFVEEKIGSVVVLDGPKPVGILTKTDVCNAYLEGRELDVPVSEVIRKIPLQTIKEDASRDEAAERLKELHVHHLVMVNSLGDFSGVVSTWDIAKECALDAKAWPWNRESMFE